MSIGLGHGRPLDPAPGVVLVDGAELPPMPDSVLEDPGSARVDPRAWFTHPDRPFEIEIGPGKGAFLIQQGALEPGTNSLGVEWAREFARYAADRVRRRREHDGTHGNIRILHTDATQWLRWRVPDSIARVVHLYFSDPWPKSRHHKKRVVQHATLLDIWRVLGDGGELRVVTDHDGLWAWGRRRSGRGRRTAGRLGLLALDRLGLEEVLAEAEEAERVAEHEHVAREVEERGEEDADAAPPRLPVAARTGPRARSGSTRRCSGR